MASAKSENWCKAFKMLKNKFGVVYLYFFFNLILTEIKITFESWSKTLKKWPTTSGILIIYIFLTHSTWEMIIFQHFDENQQICD